MSWSEIKKAINSDLSKPLNELIEEIPAEISPQIDSLKNLIGQANPGTSNRNTVMNYLRLIENSSVIKSVQRGVAKGTSSNNINISIQTVDPNKCMVIIQNEVMGFIVNSSGERLYIYGARLISITANTLTVSPSRTGGGADAFFNFSYQIIEYK